MSWRLLILAATLISACAVHPRAVIVAPASMSQDDVLPVYVGTTRATDSLGRPSRDAVSAPLSFAVHTVAYPEDRAAGDVPMARGVPNPASQFAIAGIDPFAGQTAFSSDLASKLRERPAGRRTVLVYVHGFNVTYAEGLFRTAQIMRDWQIQHVSAYFSWPSTLSPFDYAHDEQASSAARKDFVRFLEAIVVAQAESIILVGHSLGAGLVVEALSDLQAASDKSVISTIGGVFLASPDIGVERFDNLLRSIPARPDPFVIFTSTEDWILRLSSIMHGEPERLGSLDNPHSLEGHDTLVIDLSEYSEGYVNHRVAFSSPQLLAELDAWTSRPDEIGHAMRMLTGRETATNPQR
ncbi:alpha/beta fold hydrolase [Maritimibacter sp. DP07]|uniref:Alpha/beta fold hydrolase n=1 Tax=Maritimibacter harenae TaxID=2606218 RepID=A0A845LUC2_9RHOB|nr:alpha/beta fold hydrolase [Maritimibacter harenae]MZR11425.1 alpha/beta fold hydrolase [Maritimibacter harenae]